MLVAPEEVVDKKWNEFSGKRFAALGVPPVTNSAVFLNIVQTAVDPPPSFLNIAEQIFFDGFLKKRVNVCRDII